MKLSVQRLKSDWLRDLLAKTKTTPLHLTLKLNVIYIIFNVMTTLLPTTDKPTYQFTNALITVHPDLPCTPDLTFTPIYDAHCTPIFCAPRFTVHPNLPCTPIYRAPRFTMHPNLPCTPIYRVPRFTVNPDLPWTPIYHSPRFTMHPDLPWTPIHHAPRFTMLYSPKSPGSTVLPVPIGL